MAKKKPRRKPPKCIECPAPCCHDLVMWMPKPRTEDDVDEAKWHLQYETVHMFIRSNRWYLLVKGRCMYLGDDNLCTRYDTRPKRCRRHPADDCEMTGPFWDVMLRTPEELDEYLDKVKRKKARKKKIRR